MSNAPRDDRRRVLRLVRELEALSRGTDSPAEAASAAAKAQSLLLRHNLSVDALDQDQLEDEDPLTDHREEFGHGRRRIAGWRLMLLDAVARSCLCEWITNLASDPEPRGFSIIGRASNVEIAVYAFRCLERQIVELADKERARRRAAGQGVRGYLGSYREGIVHTIRERLERERLHFEADPNARALVVSRGSEAERHRRRLYPHLTLRTTYRSVEPTAHRAGRAAGAQVELRHGLPSGGTPVRLLSGNVRGSRFRGNRR